MSEFKIPEHELEKITEAVLQGIVASKQSDSQFWGEAQKYHKKMDERMGNLELKLDKGIEKLERIEIQTIKTNGRVNAIEKNYVDEKTFSPIKILVFGAVGIILTSVIVAGITMLLK